MVYEHLRFAYPGAWGALRRAHKSREEKWAKAEKEVREQVQEFTSLGHNPMEGPRPAGTHLSRPATWKKHYGRLPVAPLTATLGPVSRGASLPPGERPVGADPPQAWAIVAEPSEPPRVQADRDNVTLRLAVDSVRAKGGLQARRPTSRGKARQLVAQYHVSHERAPDGGFFMVTGADGFDIGLVKPHAERRTNLTKMYATSGSLSAR